MKPGVQSGSAWHGGSPPKVRPVKQWAAAIKAGATYDALGACHGITGERVRQILKAAGYDIAAINPRSHPQRNGEPWTPARVAVLRRMWPTHDARAIVNKLGGVTRNAVIAKARRLKLVEKPSPIKRARDNWGR